MIIRVGIPIRQTELQQRSLVMDNMFDFLRTRAPQSYFARTVAGGPSSTGSSIFLLLLQLFLKGNSFQIVELSHQGR